MSLSQENNKTLRNNWTIPNGIHYLIPSNNLYFVSSKIFRYFSKIVFPYKQICVVYVAKSIAKLNQIRYIMSECLDIDKCSTWSKKSLNKLEDVRGT